LISVQTQPDLLFLKKQVIMASIICEQKSKVRIGEGAYDKEGYLQPIGIKRAFLAIKSFLHTIDKFQAHKTLCVATSAVMPQMEKYLQAG